VKFLLSPNIIHSFQEGVRIMKSLPCVCH